MIRIVQGEIAGTYAEAVLHPMTAEWEAVTPAMRRLELAAGEGPIEQCRRLGDLPVGSAVITGAGELAAQFMIHVIVRSVEEPVTEAGVRRGFQNALRRLSEWGIRSVATPPLGIGAGNLDAEESALLMMTLLREQMDESGVPADAEVWVETDYERDVFERHVPPET